MIYNSKDLYKDIGQPESFDDAVTFKELITDELYMRLSQWKTFHLPFLEKDEFLPCNVLVSYLKHVRNKFYCSTFFDLQNCKV